MASYKMHCPACSGYFDFLPDSASVSENLTCPECGSSMPFGEYSALMKCPHCNVNLEVPVEMFSENSLSCPQCNQEFDVWAAHDISSDFDASADALYKISSGDKNLLQENDIFDKYRIIRLLGKGGMAEVYLAEHLFLKQKCALKVMKQSAFCNDQVSIRRFIREAKISHSIDCPNITKVYDVGNNVQTGFFFIAMEFIEGQTLLELSAGKTFSEEELIFIGVEMSRALVELEKHHVVHRDIKPSNIMITSGGALKLMDLGIAKSNSGDSGDMTLTMEQTTVGTPGYASPEQCRAARDVDIRADIYCLGATLYHLASGKVPFDGETLMEIILKVMQEPPEPLAKLRPDLSRHTVELIGKMMEKDPEQRPRNAEELLEFFQKKNSPVTERFLRLISWTDRKKRLLIPACLLLLAGLIAGLWFFCHSLRSGKNQPASPAGQSGEMLLPSSGTAEKTVLPAKDLEQKDAGRYNAVQPISAEWKEQEKSVLPPDGVRSLQYRIAFAERAGELLRKKQEDWFLKKEQISFYEKLLAELKKSAAAKEQREALPVPGLSKRDHLFLKSRMMNPHSNSFVMKYSWDNKITAPDGKRYTLWALCCAGLLYPSVSWETICGMQFDPDCELLAEPMKEYVSRSPEQHDARRIPPDVLVMEFIRRMVLLGRDDIDHFDDSSSFLEFVLQSCPADRMIPPHVWSTVRAMLEMGCDPNVVFSDGRTLLHFAAQQRGCEDVVRTMYFLGFDQWNRKNRNGESAYSLAVRHANPEIFELLEKIPGIRKDASDEDQKQYDLYLAVMQGNAGKIQEALDSGADANFLYGRKDNLLRIAAEHNQLQAFQKMEKYISIADNQGIAALLEGAVLGNSPEIMVHLLEKYSGNGIHAVLAYQDRSPFSVPGVILNRYGELAPDKALPLLKLCEKYGWNLWDEQSGTAQKEILDMLPRMHPDVAAYFQKLQEQDPARQEQHIPPRSELLYPVALDKNGYAELNPGGTGGIRMGSALILKKTVTPPYTLRTVCKVSGKDLRFSLSNGTLIFNWEKNPKDLRLDLPKLKSRRNRVSDGSLPRGEWVEIRISVRKTQLMIFVNGKLRNTSKGIFEPSVIGMYTCFSGSAVVKSFSVKTE